MKKSSTSLQSAYKDLAKQLELYYKKGIILKKELEQAIDKKKMQIVLEKINKIKD